MFPAAKPGSLLGVFFIVGKTIKTMKYMCLRQLTFSLIAISLVLLAGCEKNDDATVNNSEQQQGTVVASGETAVSSQSIKKELPYLAVEYLSGGDDTVNRKDVDAFGQSPAAITKDFTSDAVFKQGNFLFRGSHEGGGPLLNTAECQTCHLKDGKGMPPASANDVMASMLIKLSLGNDEHHQPIPDPIYGTQLQTLGLKASGETVTAGYQAALDGKQNSGEAFPFVEYELVLGTYPDGTPYELRKPIYKIKDPAFGEFSEGLLISPRVAPAMIGLGLLEAIPVEVLRSMEDPEDSNRDGVSGRISWVPDVVHGGQSVGRFGWKASAPSVLHQSSAAYQADMGLTNRFFMEENCTAKQSACIEQSNREKNTGDHPDISDLELASVEFYGRLLAVPQRRGYNLETQSWDEDIQQGAKLFSQINCDSCHVRHFKTGNALESALGTVKNFSELVKTDEFIAVLSQQNIWPHTDLLLHDLGGSCEPIARETANGESCESGPSCYWVQRCDGLADGRPAQTASGTEWRTTPLWGLGLVQVVNPQAGFLHDGRARTIEDAILWHAGEAEGSKNAFMELSESDRHHLLSFLNSL